VIRDAKTNHISIFNLIENITAVGFPLFMESISFLVVWERDVGDDIKYDAVVTISLDSDIIQKHNLIIDFGTSTMNRSIITINALILPKPGLLEFKMGIPAKQITVKYDITVEGIETTVTTA
jgi:hypothetical protein